MIPQSYPPVIATIRKGNTTTTRQVAGSPEAREYRNALRSHGWSVPEPMDLTTTAATAAEAVDGAQHVLRAAAPHTDGTERVRIDSILTLLTTAATHIARIGR